MTRKDTGAVMPQISIVIPVYNGEKDLPVMLHSLQQQIYTDYEVLVVNDGSLDGTLRVAEEFAQEDIRIRILSQENLGVSAARNHGLQEAGGEYIIFFDADDKAPADALKKMYDTARERQADMVVGILETVSDGKTEINQASKTLAAQNEISPRDPAFIKTWSQCNKMYRRKFLIENNIRFLPVKVAEDGHFLYQVLVHQPKICGCNSIVYQYIRRPFWEGLHTASKNVDRSYLTDRLQVYEDMLDMMEVLMEGESRQKQEAYQDALVTRFLRGGITQAFYRRIWRCDKAIQPELQQAVQRFKPLVTERCWENICQQEWDIPLQLIVEGKLTDVCGYFRSRPLVSLVLTGFSPEKVPLFMESLLNQEFPSFEVFIEEEIFQKAEGDWGNMLNITLVSRGAFGCRAVQDEIRGRYICWLDKAMLLPIHSLKRMANTMEERKELDFISVYMDPIRFRDEKIEILDKSTLISVEAVFGPLPKNKNTFQWIDQLDILAANKMFRKTAVEEVPLWGMFSSELRHFYQTRRFLKIRNAWILAEVVDKDLQRGAGRGVGPRMTKLYAVKNQMIRRIGRKLRDKVRGER